MKEKRESKKITLLIIMLLILALMVGGTIAYYSDSGIVHNIVKTGEIKIDTTHKYYRDNREIDKSKLKIVPGEVIRKTIVIKSKGLKKSYIKAKLSDEAKLLNFKVNDANWINKDDEYYYKGILGEEDVTLDIDILLPTEITSEYAKKILNLDTSVYAVQKDNNSDSSLKAFGWDNEEE